MKQTTLLIFLLISFLSWGQDNSSKIVSIFQNADSIVLVSHESLITSGEPGKGSIKLKLVLDGNLNYAIVHEIAKLDRNSIDTLTHLLTEPNNDTEIWQLSCFDPHHAICIYKKGKLTYFNICFGCQKFVLYDRDIVEEKILDQKVWQELESFFKARKFNYEMPNENKPIQ